LIQSLEEGVLDATLETLGHKLVTNCDLPPLICPKKRLPNALHVQLYALARLLHGVRDTAVADDLDTASRIAYEGSQRRRVVTLAGQLIETSGTMSGGGNKPRGGRMCTGASAPVIGAVMDAEESAAAVAEAERELSTVGSSGHR
jgi:hypothetical protein